MNPIGWFRSKARAPLTDASMLAVRTAAAEAQRSRIPQMAAALSFRTLFGLIPMVVVALLVVNYFTSDADRAMIIRRAMEYTGLKNISVSGEPVPASPKADKPDPATLPGIGEEGGAQGPPAPPEIVATLNSGSRDLDEWLTTLIERAGSGASFGAIGLVGFAMLVYAAVAMLVEIERAFNQVFRVPRGRSWFRRVVNYWTLLTLGGVGLAATFYVGAKFQIWAQNLVEERGLQLGSGAFTVHIIGYSVTVAISTALLALIYATVPNTRVRALAAVVGAFMAALLWEAGKFGFGQYIAFSSGYARLYGSLALIPLFMLWVYFTWLIVLFGLAVTYQFQHGRLKTQPQPLSDLGPSIVEPTAGLLVMSAMARAMGAGTPQSVGALAKSTGLGEGVVSLVVARFAERGLLLRVERDGEGADPLYALARTPGSIRVGEVLALGFELAGGPESNPVVERMRRAQINAAGSETLADIAGLPAESRPATPPAPAADRPVLLAQGARP